MVEKDKTDNAAAYRQFSTCARELYRKLFCKK